MCRNSFRNRAAGKNHQTANTPESVLVVQCQKYHSSTKLLENKRLGYLTITVLVKVLFVQILN